MGKITELYPRKGNDDIDSLIEVIDKIIEAMRINMETQNTVFTFLVHATKKIEVMLLWLMLLTIVEFLAAILWIIGK